MSKEILELTLTLQYMLERMSDSELASFMQGKLLRYDGKLYHKLSEVSDDNQVTSTKQQDEEITGDKVI